MSETRTLKEIAQDVLASGEDNVYRDGFEICLRTGIEDYVYRVPTDEITSHEEIVFWAMHLSEKSWCDIGMLRKFMALATKVVRG